MVKEVIDAVISVNGRFRSFEPSPLPFPILRNLRVGVMKPSIQNEPKIHDNVRPEVHADHFRPPANLRPRIEKIQHTSNAKRTRIHFPERIIFMESVAIWKEMSVEAFDALSVWRSSTASHSHDDICWPAEKEMRKDLENREAIFPKGVRELFKALFEPRARSWDVGFVV